MLPFADVPRQVPDKALEDSQEELFVLLPHLDAWSFQLHVRHVFLFKAFP